MKASTRTALGHNENPKPQKQPSLPSRSKPPQKDTYNPLQIHRSRFAPRQSLATVWKRDPNKQQRKWNKAAPLNFVLVDSCKEQRQIIHKAARGDLLRREITHDEGENGGVKYKLLFLGEYICAKWGRHGEVSLWWLISRKAGARWEVLLDRIHGTPTTTRSWRQSLQSRTVNEIFEAWNFHASSPKRFKQ